MGRAAIGIAKTEDGRRAGTVLQILLRASLTAKSEQLEIGRCESVWAKRLAANCHESVGAALATVRVHADEKAAYGGFGILRRHQPLLDQ